MRALQPNTRYTITVDAAVADRFGQRMQGPHVAEFGTGDGTPRLDIETGAWVVEATRPGYPAWSRNLTSIEADITAVPETKLGELAGQLDWWDQDVLDVKKVGLKTKHVTIPIKGRKNQWDQIQIEPAKLLGSASPPAGFYYIALRAPEEPHPGVTEPPPREMLLNFTNLGVTAKLSGPSGLVWVTRLSDGQPQPGADVTIRDSKGKVRWHGTTDADGLAVTPGHAQLCPSRSARSATARPAATTTSPRTVTARRAASRKVTLRGPAARTCWCSRGSARTPPGSTPNARAGSRRGISTFPSTRRRARSSCADSCTPTAVSTARATRCGSRDSPA